MANDMKKLSEDILTSYRQRAAEVQQRLKDNAEIVKEVKKALDGFHNDHMEMAATLRANATNLRLNLAKEQKERLKSFQQLMHEIHGSISQLQDEVEDIKKSTAGLIKDFSVSHDEMTEKLHKEFAQDQTSRLNWNKDRMRTFDNLMANIKNEIIKVQEEVVDVLGYTDKLLKGFSNEHSEMSVAMRAELKSNLTERVEYIRTLLSQFDKRLAEINKENKAIAEALQLELQKSRKELSQNDKQRMKDFNITFTEIQKRVDEIQTFVKTYLDEFLTDRKQAAATWEKMSESIAKLRKIPEAEPVGKKKAKELEITDKKESMEKKEIVVEEKPIVETEIEKTIMAAEKTKMEEPEKALTLEEKVLQYINTHKKGVRVAEMEKPFGATRMRLGFIAKKLLDEGKVSKVENTYFPMPKL